MSLARGLCFVCRFGACWYQENTHQTHLLSKWEDGPTQIHFSKLSNPNYSHQGHQPTVKKHLQLRFSSSQFNICPPLLQFQPVYLPWLHLPRGNAMGGTMLATVREWFYISTLTSTGLSVNPCVMHLLCVYNLVGLHVSIRSWTFAPTLRPCRHSGLNQPTDVK